MLSIESIDRAKEMLATLNISCISTTTGCPVPVCKGQGFRRSLLEHKMVKKLKKDLEPPPKDVFEPLAIESKKAGTAVLMLQSPEEDILAKACEALYKFAQKGDENKLTLLGLGAVESLSKLISHEDKTVRRNATMVCGIMAGHNDVRKLLRKLDIIPSLIARLAPEEEVVIHEFATLCLSHMALDYTSKARLFELHAIEPLVHLLSSADPDVKKHSVECIYLLLQDVQTRAAVRELHAIPPLLELLKSEYPIIQQLSLKVLSIVSCESETRQTLNENQALDQLLKILETKEFNDLHVEALLVISNCLEDGETVQLLQQSGGLKKILTFAETSLVPDIQKNAAKAIAKSANNAENRKFFHEQEVEKTLVHMLGIDNDSVRSAACLAISAMSANLASKELFNKMGIPQLISVLKRDNEELRESAVSALANLTTGSPNNASAVAEAEGVGALINLLSDKSDASISNACTVLINMAAQEPLRLLIQTHGVMEALAEPLQSSNKLVLSKAALTVAAVACDVDARTELRNAGGLPPLVKLLLSDYDEVRRNACWAIAVCASDELTAVEFCRLGALEILQELNLSTSRRNNFSELAYDKLLDNNLSLKYSQKGYLSYSNLIEDGFYDCGRIKPEAKLLSLGELSKQEINHNRAVILVNAKAPEITTALRYPVDENQEINLARSSSSHSQSAPKEKTGILDCSVTEEKQEPLSARSPSVSRNSYKDKPPSRGKSKSKKDEEKPKGEEEIQQPNIEAEITIEKQQWLLPFDQDLNSYISEASKTILPLLQIKEQVVSLAQFVGEKMGGPVKQLHEFDWELHISELKFKLQRNVIPIGKIKKGTFYHRALLFKVIADRFGIGCCLIRGDYNRAWNIVKLVDELAHEGTRVTRCPETYVVDLMYEPGRLLKPGSIDADYYQHI
ncbi:armadillo repeat-containing protein 3 [Bombina bombina]|uniref:armadillo repeat-containing protein 3 n=1 Tax=Bombina bombina TaxID=8345 RepID=UPI00235AD83D|nr:armadillo repeat-containing protein 3 [Bombina bombina]